MRLRLTAILLVVIAASSAAPAAAQRTPLRIAAASDLQTALPAITSAFEQATGIRTTTTFGSSGNFFAQIQNGAPFDVFFSADADYPRRLADAGQMIPATVFEYARGGLVLWTRKDSGIAPSLDALRDPGVRRIAIANPAVAPYGRAAMAALESAGLMSAVEPKLVRAENVTQAAQLADSGNADIALIGHALALGPALRASGHFVEIAERLHPPIAQGAGVVSTSRRPADARALLDFLRSETARTILESFGFSLPPRRR